MRDELVDQLSDLYEMPIGTLMEILEKIKDKYGANAILVFDAGYENICVSIKGYK